VSFAGENSGRSMPTKIYRYHVENLRKIELTINHISRLARNTIASRDPENSLLSLLRLYSFLIGAWAETRLKKLLNEERGFCDSDRNEILTVATQMDQWKLTIEKAFRNHYGVKKAELNNVSLGETAAARFNVLNKIINEDLRILIEIRNKLAHGQWIYPFNSEGTAIEQDKYRLINQENLQSLQFKYALVKHLADTVHDLVVSKATFERDFDAHFKQLNQVKINLERKKYSDYEDMLIKRRIESRRKTKLT
jgi:hypothetical protein